MCALPAFAALPNGYTELEYIESTGTQYIDTGINSYGLLRMSAKIYTNRDAGYSSAFSGVMESLLWQVVYPYGGVDFNVSGSGDEVIFTGDYTGLQVFDVDQVNKTVSLNGVVQNMTKTPTVGTLTHNIPLGKYWISNENEHAWYGKIYYVQIYNNGTLVRDFVPAKRNNDNEIGMYDTVNNRFYENAGTGTFVAGPIACSGIWKNYESAVGTVSQNGTPTPTNPVEPTFYQQGDMVLRAIGDSADLKDSYDATTGKITRRVGVKVLDGTESWDKNAVANYYRIPTSSLSAAAGDGYCTHFHHGVLDTLYNFDIGSTNINFSVDTSLASTTPEWKQWVAQQYANGTPVTVYYPLAEAVEETPASTTYCADPIKIATTAYNDAQFAPVEQALESAVTTIKDVVANTIVQADAIQNLQDTKQTMPDASGTNGTCPRFRQCLLIETASGTPQWFPIIDPFRDFVTPILANNDNITPVDAQRRYYGDQQFCTALADTNFDKCENNTPAIVRETVSYNTLHGALNENEWGYEFKAADIGATPATDNPNNDEGIVYGISKCVSSSVQTNSITSATKLDNVPSPYQSAIRGELERQYDYSNPTYGLDTYTQCWCKMKSIVYDGKLYETSNAPWVFLSTRNSGSCASQCAYSCSGNFSVTADLRQSIMGWAVE